MSSRTKAFLSVMAGNTIFGFSFIFLRNTSFLNDRLNDRINDRIKTLDNTIISAIKENKYITTAELVKLTGKSSSTINRHIKSLSEDGKISRIGSKKAGYWELTSTVEE